MGDACHADFGITHGRGVVAVYRAEVALAVYQHIAHGEVLRHAHNGVVYGDVAVRVVFTNHIADNTRRFFIRPVPVVVQFVHGVQYAPVHRLEAVAHIGQGAPHNHAHGVIQIGAAHFLFKRNGQGFFGKQGVGHGNLRLKITSRYSSIFAEGLPVLIGRAKWVDWMQIKCQIPVVVP